jgi:hypothetical protein
VIVVDDSGRGFLPRLGFRMCSTRSKVRPRILRFCFGRMCLRWFGSQMRHNRPQGVSCLPVPELPRLYRLAFPSIFGLRSIARPVI